MAGLPGRESFLSYAFIYQLLDRSRGSVLEKKKKVLQPLIKLVPQINIFTCDDMKNWKSNWR